MQVEFGAARVDHDFAGVVVEKEGDVHALGGHLDPLAASALALPFPDYGAVVVAGALGDGRDHCIRSNGVAAEFHHSHGCAANFGNRSVEDEVPALQQAEAIEKKIEAGAESDGAPDDGAGGIGGMK